MTHSTFAATLFVACLAAPAIAQQPVPVTLNYNFNGMIHAGEAGLPDDPAGFRSISDRAVDWSAGIPSDALLDKYSIVSTPGSFDIVHLGDRNTVDNGNHFFDATANGDNVGTQPLWLPVVDQSGPQTSVITPMPVNANTIASFIYVISNGGGDFDVTFDFAGGGSLTQTLSGPDWFFGGAFPGGFYPGTQDVDFANTGNDLYITEGSVDLGAFAGDAVLQITFSNRSNPIGNYAIIGCSFEEPARHTQVGVGCYPVSELAGWHQEFVDAAAAEAALDNQALLYLPNGSGGYTTVAASGTMVPGNPSSLVSLADDQQIGIFLPAAFNFRGTTPISVVYLSSNGFLSMGAGNGTRVAEQPAFYSAANAAAIVAYGDDLDPNLGAAGTISTDYDAGLGVFYITFEDVPNFPGDPVIDGTVSFQYQLELASGVCTVVYGDMVLGTTPQADNVCIGETVPSATVPNAIDIFATGATDTFGVETIADGVILSADVPAVSTATTGTSVVYSVSAAPDFSPSVLPGTKLGLFITSFAPLAPLPGLDLGFIGAPSCPLFLTSLDFIEAFDLAGTFTVPYPAGIPAQTTLFFQAAMLFDTADPAYPTSPAGSNGNTFTQTSNALITVISNY